MTPPKTATAVEDWRSRRWRASEIELARRLHAKGLTKSQIAAELGRSPDAVSSKTRQFAKRNSDRLRDLARRA